MGGMCRVDGIDEGLPYLLSVGLEFIGMNFVAIGPLDNGCVLESPDNRFEIYCAKLFKQCFYDLLELLSN